MGYVKLSPEFVKGLNKWIDIKGFNRMDEIVEVFAGDGKLGRAINLPKENITDNYSWRGYRESLDPEWIEASEENVYEISEDATDTIKRFKRENKEIKLLIMAFPPEFDHSAYLAAKELSNTFNEALIFYIGTDGYTSRLSIASEVFFEHIDDVDDPSVLVRNKNENFDSLVRDNYEHELKDEKICATLKRFEFCGEINEKCLASIEIEEWCKW